MLRRGATEGGFAPDGRQLELAPLDDGDIRDLLAAITHDPAPARRGRAHRGPGGREPARAGRAGAPRSGAGRGRRPPRLARGAHRGRDRRAEPVPAAPARLRLGPRAQLQPAGVATDPQRRRDRDRRAGRPRSCKQFVQFDPAGVARFRQAVVRDVAYRGLPYRRRRVLHLRAGQVMERIAAGAIDSVAEPLSVHFFEGGDLERAWRYARLAGARAQASYANSDAAALYRRALEAGSAPHRHRTGRAARDLDGPRRCAGAGGLARRRRRGVSPGDRARAATTTSRGLGSSSSEPVPVSARVGSWPRCAS